MSHAPAENQNSKSNPTSTNAGRMKLTSVRQKLYWSVRRELWEHRVVFIAPLVVALLVLVAFALITMTASIPQNGDRGTTSAAKVGLALAGGGAAATLVATMVLLGCFYCIDVLASERRDRSILFWKSLPVSDATTILAKFAVPIVVLPLFSIALIAAYQCVILLSAGLIGGVRGTDSFSTQGKVPLGEFTVGLAYFIATLTLWYAPIYSGLMLISAWAKRGALMWAVVPPLALLAIEKAALHTSLISDFLQHRLLGAYEEAFTDTRIASGVKSVIDPARFFSSPSLWIGLVVASALLFATIRLRRRREVNT
jgi:ABC-2 type transport system permease protein